MPEPSPLSETQGSNAEVHRYAYHLVWEARQQGRRRLREARRLVAIVKLLDPEAADELIRAVEATNRRELGMAELHAREVIELSRPHPADEDVRSPNPRRRHAPEDYLDSILRKVEAMVEAAERTSQGHFEEAAHLAQLLGHADPDAADRILTAARSTSTSQLAEARLAAAEISSAAKVRSRALVESFARMLAAEAERSASRRSPRAERLLASLGRVDPAVARRVQAALSAAEAGRLDGTRREADMIAERARTISAGDTRQD